MLRRIGLDDADLRFRQGDRRGKPLRSKTVTCAAEQCEVVEIAGTDFLRLVEKSRVVRESFARLNAQRTAENRAKQQKA